MTSINFNASATTALRTLQSTNTALETTQNRVATGLKIGEAKDNAAYWSISTTLKSDNKSLSTIKDALNLGAATVDVAYQGLNKAKDVLDEIKTKLTSATQAGVDRTAIQADISALQDQLKSIATSSNFSGENWLSVNSAVTGYDPEKTIVASFSRDAANTIAIGTIKVDTSKTALIDIASGGKGIVDKAVALKKADGTALLVGGVNTTTPAPVVQGLDGAVNKAGTAVAIAKAGFALLGTTNVSGIDVNDTLTFNIAVDGGAAKAIKVDLTGVTDQGSLFAKINSSLSTAGVTGVTASTDTDTGQLKLLSSTTGANSSVVVTGLAGFNGDTVLSTAKFGLTNAATPVLGTGTAATSAAGAYANGGAVVANDQLKFTFEYNGDLYDASYTYASTTAGATDADFKVILDNAIAGAVKRFTTDTLGSNKIVTTVAAGGISLATVAKGPDAKVSITSVTALAANGAAAATPAYVTKGLSVSTANVAGTGTAATFSLGTAVDDATGAGNTLTFDVTIGSDKTGATVLTTKTISFSTGVGGTVAQMQSNAQAAFDAAFGANVVTVGAGMGLTTVHKGSKESIVVNGITETDGDGTTTSLLGLTNQSGTGSDATVVAAGTSTVATAFAAQTFSDVDKVKFDVSVNGGAAKTVTIDKALMDATLSAVDGYTVGSGEMATSAQYLKVVKQAITNAGISGVTASIVAAGNDAGKLQLTTNTTGVGNSVTIGNVKTEGGSTADTISVTTIDLTSSTFTALTDNEKSDVLSAYLSVVNNALTSVISAASSLGSVSSRIDLQNSFVDTLINTIYKGVSNLIDADLSEESTKLQALQTKQSLGIQALSIANSSQQNILRLFQ